MKTSNFKFYSFGFAIAFITAITFTSCDDDIIDLCEDITCNTGEECQSGVCVDTTTTTSDPCEGVSCNSGEECQNGICVDTTATSACAGTAGTFNIDLDPSGCSVNLSISRTFSETTSGDIRTITSNSIPNHKVGSFPNSGNPNTISSQGTKIYEIDLTPSLAGTETQLTINGNPNYKFGILLSGVVIDPIAAEWFTNPNTGQDNKSWNESPLSSNIHLGTDCNNAHVQPSGEYHYHAAPSAYVESLGIDGSAMVKIGYAADGFPIYYKYGYSDDGTTIIELTSSYELEDEDRGGNGISAPSGCPDGTYVQDYEYVEAAGDLDACNGRTGKTPESNSEYYYVITENWPSSPMCLSGTPSTDFKLGPP